MLTCLAGCASSHVPKPAPAKLEPWTFESHPGHIARTNHYAIHTTIEDDDLVQTLAIVMEAAHSKYQQFAPGSATSTAPLDCFVFSRRSEWARFTEQNTGADAALYLQINRGGYTVRDWFVAYFVGNEGTIAVAAHEGWHQYVARNFRSRLPPFLEEGIATMFESVRIVDGTPRWDLSPRSFRARKLYDAIQTDSIWPLPQLVTMHAGEIVSLPPAKIEAFYAQSWAFAEFLWDADGGK
ncbi:MAG: hypothetical protein ACREJC_05050, partial [Tepidisphaeraceae bacterium]